MAAGSDFSVFVGDLDASVGDLDLQSLFRSFYPSVRSAKVITDPQSGRSKGYGFVRFGNELERDRSLIDMNGQILASRPIRVSLATAKKGLAPIQGGIAPVSSPSHPSDFDPSNTTLFIGGLSAGLTEDELRAYFAPFGDIVYTKIPPGKGCGFVQFVNRANAEVALQSMQGQVLGQSSIRISWGRSSSNSRPTASSYGGQSTYSYPSSTGVGAYDNGGQSSFPGQHTAYDASSYGQAYGNPQGAASTADAYAAYYAQIAAQDTSGYQALLAAYQQQQGQGQQAQQAQHLQQAAYLQPQGIPPGAGPAPAKAPSQSLYDPRSSANVEELNRLLVERHQNSMLGAFRHSRN